MIRGTQNQFGRTRAALSTCGRAKTHFLLSLKRSFFLILLSLSVGLAQATDEPQILFLHLKLKNQQVSLVKTVTRPGVLKRARDGAADELHYELLTDTGESRWKAAVADPTIRHLEYEDPPGSGNLKRKLLFLAEAEFTVRVPVVAKARRVEFYKLELSTPDANGEQHHVKKTVGSVPLP